MINLVIEVVNYETEFRDDFVALANWKIAMVGTALSNAKKFLEGDWRVTSRGYLVRYVYDKLPTARAKLDIQDNLYGLNNLGRVMRGEIPPYKIFKRIHLHCGGDIIFITVGEHGIRLCIIPDPPSGKS